MSEREEYSGDLSAYLDGELSESRRRRLDEVLQYDRELAGELDRLRATRELIHSLPVKQPPRGFSARIVARAERSRLFASRRQPRSYRWITLAAAAVVLVAAGLSVVIMKQLSREQAPDTDTIDRVGHVARVVDGVEGTDNGDVAERPGKRIDRVATPGPPEGRFKETAGHGPKSSLETTLDDAREAARRLTKKDAGQDDFVIYTSNLAFAQADVENVLAYNGIHPVRATLTQNAVPGKDVHARNNFYNPTQTAITQVQIEVFVPPKQAAKIKNELNVLRAQQDVSQAVTPLPVLAGAFAAKAAKVARGKTGTDATLAAAGEELAERKARSKAKHAPKPKPAKGNDDPDKKLGVGRDADRARGAKTADKLNGKGDLPPKTVGQKPGGHPKPTTRPGLGVADIADQTAIADQTKEGLPPAPAAARPVGGPRTARQTQGKVAEQERHPGGKRPDFGKLGELSDSQKVQTAATIAAPAKGPKRRPSTQAAPDEAPRRQPSTQTFLAIRPAVTSQRAEKAESQVRANVTRLLITLNFRGAQPPTGAEALLKLNKATSQDAARAVEVRAKARKAETNKSH